MTIKEIDYSRTIIYKLVHKDVNAKLPCYVGFTTDLYRRKAQLKMDCNHPHRKNYNMKMFEEIRNNGGFDNYELVIMEKYPCNNSSDAKMRERYWNEKLNGKEEPITKPVFTIEDKNEVEEVFNEFVCKEIDEKVEKKKSYNKEYYQKNKKEKHCIEDYCAICDLKYFRNNANRHIETKGHLKNIIKGMTDLK